MAQKTDLAAVIDERNLHFTSHVKAQLRDLDAVSDEALEWLMLEHFQFSSTNPGFLAAAARTTEQLEHPGVARELERNYREEDGHAAIYEKGLAEIGTLVDEREEFTPTSRFLARIRQLTVGDPSVALGAMYATETAAIFEHEIFWDISREVCVRRGIAWDDTILKGFHDMHLGGVEQSHKDELGVFVSRSGHREVGEGVPISDDDVMAGAAEAIDAMVTWWDTLVSEALIT